MGPECPSSWFGWVDMSAVGKINVLLSLAAEQMFSDRWTSTWCNMCRKTFSNQHKQQIKTCSLLIIQQSCRLLQRFPSLPLCYRQFKLPIYRSRREATGQIIDKFPSGGLGMISCVGIGTAGTAMMCNENTKFRQFVLFWNCRKLLCSLIRLLANEDCCQFATLLEMEHRVHRMNLPGGHVPGAQFTLQGNNCRHAGLMRTFNSA